MEREKRIESSMSVQGRISLIDLAKIDEYFYTNGHIMSSMSQLLNWTAGQLANLLEVNGVRSEIKDLRDAVCYLENRGIYKGKLKERDKGRLRIIKGLDNMRLEGGNSYFDAPRLHNTLHNERTVEVFEDKNEIVVDEDLVASIKDRVKKIRGDLKEENRLIREKTKLAAIDAGIIKEDENE